MCCVPKSCSILSDRVDRRPPRPLCPWDSPGKNTGVGCHFFLQGHLPDPEIKPASPALASPTKPPGKLLKSNAIIIAGHEWCINAANRKAYSKRERVDVQLLG